MPDTGCLRSLTQRAPPPPAEAAIPATATSGRAATGCVLLVDPRRHHGPAGRSGGRPNEASAGPATGGPVVTASPETLDADLLDRVAPALILTPLFTPSFDIVQLLERLDNLGWTGAVRAITGPLPDPGLVLGEIRRTAPGRDVDLIVLPT